MNVPFASLDADPHRVGAAGLTLVEEIAAHARPLHSEDFAEVAAAALDECDVAGCEPGEVGHVHPLVGSARVGGRCPHRLDGRGWGASGLTGAEVDVEGEILRRGRDLAHRRCPHDEVETYRSGSSYCTTGQINFLTYMTDAR
jgi:hypothetical protein